MNIQIIGTKKCRDTQKAERFFKERGVKYHFKDLLIKPLSKGELNNILRGYELEDLLDREGRQFKKRNLEYILFDTEEELLSDPLLLKTPIVRSGGRATIGFKPDVWKRWIDE